MRPSSLDIDSSTGAWSRRFFEEALCQAVLRSHRGHIPLCVLYVDVDEQLELRDLHGEPATEAAFGQVAQTLSEVLDGRGPIGRLSPGVYGSYLEGLPLAPAAAFARQVREGVARALHPSREGAFRQAVSIGVVQLRAAEPWGNLLDAAELCCLNAKQSGRNAVVTRGHPGAGRPAPRR